MADFPFIPSSNEIDDEENDDLFVSAINNETQKENSLSEDLSKINIQTYIEPKVEPKAEPNEEPNAELNIEPNIEPIIEDINLNEDDDESLKTSNIQTSSNKDTKSHIDTKYMSLDRVNLSHQPAIYKMSEDSNSNCQIKSQSEKYIDIKISDPKKIGEGMTSFVFYKVTTKTNYNFFRKEVSTVYRRFSDFLGLREKLAEKHLFLGRLVPPAPEKDAYNTAKVKIAKENTEQVDFLEKRSAALQRFINRVAAHPILLSDPDFREFLELETELPKSKDTSALSKASVKRFLNRVGETVNKMTFKMDETDPWFEEKQHEIENLDQQLRKLNASVEALIHYRKELTFATGYFSKTAALLGNCEEHTSLSCALSQLAETQEKLEQLYSNQVNSDFYYLAELIKDYINLIGVVKNIFHNRVKVYQTWKNASLMLEKKRDIKSKFEQTAKIDKLPLVNEEITEWEAKMARGQEDFENISKTIKSEVEKFQISRIKDFKTNIVKYLESLLETQNQIVKQWESFLPEARAIS